jgi:hypothetical protein
MMQRVRPHRSDSLPAPKRPQAGPVFGTPEQTGPPLVRPESVG